MTTIILGNGNNLLVSDDNSNGDTIIVRNGINDIVSANNSQYDTITLAACRTEALSSTTRILTAIGRNEPSLTARRASSA